MKKPQTPKIIGALFASSAMILGTQTIAHAEESPQNTLHWSVRDSFNNYTGGPTEFNGGVSKNYDFPLKSATYTETGHKTEAQFQGELVYMKYCQDYNHPTGDSCALDLHIKDPKVVISDTESYVEATVNSKQYPSGDRYKPATPVKIAALKTSSATFNKTGGKISWSNIAATLTEDGLHMFSYFYKTGEGLSPVSFSYNGEGNRPASDSGKPVLTDKQWTSPSGYDHSSTAHAIYDADPNIIVAIPEKGFALLDSDLKQLAITDEISAVNGFINAYDAANKKLYYADGKELKAIKVNGSSFSEPATVFTSKNDIQAIGYNPYSKTVVALAASGEETQQATLISNKSGSFAESELPNTTTLFGNKLVKASEPWFDLFNKERYLLPMPDGTFVYSATIEVNLKPNDEDTHTKGILYLLDPAATETAKRATFLQGSPTSDTTDYDHAVSKDNRIYRWSGGSYSSKSSTQILTYDSATHNVTSVAGPVDDTTVWASLGFEPDGTAIKYDGANGELTWLQPNSFKKAVTPAPFTIPNGAKTNKEANVSFVVRKDGAIFIQTRDESASDGEDHYILRKIVEPRPEQSSASNSDDEKRLAELKAKAEAEKAQEDAQKQHTAEQNTPTAKDSNNESQAVGSNSAKQAEISELNKHQFAINDEIQFKLGLFRPGTDVKIILHSTPIEIMTVKADANGIVTGAFRVPAGLELGAHTLIGQGIDSNGNSVSREISLELTNPARDNQAQAQPQLPNTGSNGSEIPTTAALILLLASGISLAVRRKS